MLVERIRVATPYPFRPETMQQAEPGNHDVVGSFLPLMIVSNDQGDRSAHHGDRKVGGAHPREVDRRIREARR
jgi:hypothetical protein